MAPRTLGNGLSRSPSSLRSLGSECAGGSEWTATSRRCHSGSRLSAATCAISPTPRTRWVAETIKFRDRPYFVFEGNVCALLAAKDHVNVFLYDGAIVPDPEHIITGGHDNTTARTVAIRQGERLNAPALLAMFKQIIANNRAGGWLKVD